MDRDAPAIYLALILAGLVPAIGGIVRGGPVGAGVTLAMLMAALGTIGLISAAWRAWRRRHQVPTVRAVRRTVPLQTR